MSHSSKGFPRWGCDTNTRRPASHPPPTSAAPLGGGRGGAGTHHTAAGTGLPWGALQKARDLMSSSTSAPGHIPLCSSASPPELPGPTKSNFSRKTWKLRRIQAPLPHTHPRILGPLYQVFSSPFWYLVSLDAWQALWPWNSRGPLLPLWALRRKETKGVNQMRCQDMLPTAYLS